MGRIYIKRICRILVMAPAAYLCSGCAVINGTLNAVFQLIPLLLFISIDDPSEYGSTLALRVPLDMETIAVVEDFDGEPMRLEVSGQEAGPDGMSAIVTIQFGADEAVPVRWSGRMWFPYDTRTETNILAGFRVSGHVSPHRRAAPTDRIPDVVPVIAAR